jgi:hypothetical protein
MTGAPNVPAEEPFSFGEVLGAAAQFLWSFAISKAKNFMIYALILPILTGGWFYRRSSGLSGVLDTWNSFATWSNRHGPRYQYRARDYARLGLSFVAVSWMFWSLCGMALLVTIWQKWIWPYISTYWIPLLKEEWQESQKVLPEELEENFENTPLPSGKRSHTRRGTQARNRNPHARISSSFYDGIWTNVDRTLATLFYKSSGTRADEIRIREELTRYVKERGIVPETWEDLYMDKHQIALETLPDDASDELRDTFSARFNNAVWREKSMIPITHPQLEIYSWRIVQTAFGRLRENPWYLEMKDDARHNSDVFKAQASLAAGQHLGTHRENLMNLWGRICDNHGLGSSGPKG